MLEAIQKQQRVALDYRALAEKIRLYTARGDAQGAEEIIQGALRALPAEVDAQTRDRVRTGLQLVHACARNDVPAFLKLAAQVPAGVRFESAFLQGKFQETAAGDGQRDDQALVEHALLYLGAHKADAQKLADDHWQKLLALLARHDQHHRRLGDMLAGRKPLDADVVRRLPIEPQKKRVLLVVVAQRLPEKKKELLALARALDFHKDGTSLCLGRVLD